MMIPRDYLKSSKISLTCKQLRNFETPRPTVFQVSFASPVHNLLDSKKDLAVTEEHLSTAFGLTFQVP